MDKTSNKAWFVVLLLIVTGSFLRLYKSSVHSLWADDGFSIWLSLRNLKEILAIIRDFDPHPPLYYFILHFWAKLGQSALWLRLPSIIFSILSLVVMYLFIKELFKDKKIALLGLFLLTFSQYHAFFSQQIRMYSLLDLLSLLSVYYFIRLFKENKFSLWAGFYVFTLLALYTHYMSFFVILVENIIAVLFYKKFNFKKWFFLQLLLLLSYTPWYYSFFTQIQCASGPERPFGFFWKYFLDPLVFFFAGVTLNYNENFFNFLTFLVGLCLILGIFSLKKEKFPLAFLSVYLGIPLFCLALYSWIFKHNLYSEKYFIFLLPIFLIFIVNGAIVNKKNLIKIVSFILLILFLVFNCISFYNWYYKPEYQYQNWKQATNFLLSKSSSKDGIIIQNPFQRYIFNYYFKKSNKQYYITEKNMFYLHQILEKHKYIWLISSGEYAVDPEHKVFNWLNERCKLVKGLKFFSFAGHNSFIIIILFERQQKEHKLKESK